MMGSERFSFLLFLLVVHVSSGMTDTVAHLTAVATQLTSKADHISTQLIGLTADIQKKDCQIAALTSDLDAKQLLITNLTSQLAQQTAKLTSLDSYCTTHMHDLYAQIGSLQHGVGFSVRFNSDTVGELANETINRWYHVLKFDAVLYELGGANYDNSTGRFTAPSAGVYAFFLTIQRSDATANDCVEAAIMRDPRMRVTTVTACPMGFTTASNMGLAHLAQGDTVYVETDHADRLFGYVHTSFSGFKIAEQ